MRALARYAVSAAFVFTVGACKSAEEKCAESRVAATSAWTVYIDALAGEITTARELIIESQRTLKTGVEPRINDAATKLTDSRYMAGSEAWSRGRVVAFNDLCTKDPECHSLKHGIAEATAALKDLEERLGPATVARKELESNPGGAKAAADAAIIDPQRPALKMAQAASAQTQALCAAR